MIQVAKVFVAFNWLSFRRHGGEEDPVEMAARQPPGDARRLTTLRRVTPSPLLTDFADARGSASRARSALASEVRSSATRLRSEIAHARLEIGDDLLTIRS